MLKIMLSALLAFIVASCGSPRYVDYFPYHDDGTQKPRVALMTMVNSTEPGLPWNVAEELSEALYYKLMGSGQLYVLSPQEVGPIWAQQGTIDFFDHGMPFCSQFQQTDFIVVLELIEHSVLSSQGCQSAPECHLANRLLNLGLRVKVIDNRCEEPRVVLYEIIRDSYRVTPPLDEVDYEQAYWGSERYALSPCAKLHQRAVRRLAERLEEVITSMR